MYREPPAASSALRKCSSLPSFSFPQTPAGQSQSLALLLLSGRQAKSEKELDWSTRFASRNGTASKVLLLVVVVVAVVVMVVVVVLLAVLLVVVVVVVVVMVVAVVVVVVMVMVVVVVVLVGGRR